ncbi:MAG: hypothetical protein JO057_27895 [Chloroflexi bacterium]|nr:hypothetical protein [Chloroflexota bacterium]
MVVTGLGLFGLGAYSASRGFAEPQAAILVPASLAVAVPADLRAQVSSSSAAAVVLQLQAAIPTVALTTDFTSATDPDGNLGVPGQYMAKAQFSDSSASPAIVGYVEVFATASDVARSSTNTMPGETNLAQGRVLVRFTTPVSQATLAAYQVALSTIPLP